MKRDRENEIWFVDSAIFRFHFMSYAWIWMAFRDCLIPADWVIAKSATTLMGRQAFPWKALEKLLKAFKIRLNYQSAYRTSPLKLSPLIDISHKYPRRRHSHDQRRSKELFKFIRQSTHRGAFNYIEQREHERATRATSFAAEFIFGYNSNSEQSQSDGSAVENFQVWPLNEPASA